MRNYTNLFLVSMIVLAVVIGCDNKESENRPTGEPQAKSTENSPTVSDTPIAIQAKTLTKEYEENEVAADNKYRNKLLEVSGKISNIAETLGRLTIQIEGHKFLETVMCSLEENERDNVAKLKKGQTVTVIGRGDGKTSTLYVGLNDCRIK